MRAIKLILLISALTFASCKTEKAIVNSPEEDKINVELKKELERIILFDQGIREIVNGNLSVEREAELLNKMDLKKGDIEGNKVFSVMREIDSINLIKVESIIKLHGYPAKALVGEPANKAVFYVIQHSDKIEQYLPLIRKAAEEGEVANTSLAMMEDRNLMDKGFEQIYGTQIRGKANKEGKWISFLWPVKNPETINILRKNAGFDRTIEEYLEAMGVEKKFYKLEEVDDL